MLLNCGVGEDSWVPWTARRSNQSILKEITSEYSLEGLMLKLKLQYFGHLMWRTDSGKDSDAGKDWRQEEKGTTEDEMVGWHHQCNGHEFLAKFWSWWWTGKPGVLQSIGSQSQTRLSDWTELNWLENYLAYFQYTNIKKRERNSKSRGYIIKLGFDQHPDSNNIGKSPWHSTSGVPIGKRSQAACPFCKWEFKNCSSGFPGIITECKLISSSICEQTAALVSC